MIRFGCKLVYMQTNNGCVNEAGLACLRWAPEGISSVIVKGAMVLSASFLTVSQNTMLCRHHYLHLLKFDSGCFVGLHENRWLFCAMQYLWCGTCIYQTGAIHESLHICSDGSDGPKHTSNKDHCIMHQSLRNPMSSATAIWIQALDSMSWWQGSNKLHVHFFVTTKTEAAEFEMVLQPRGMDWWTAMCHF